MHVKGKPILALGVLIALLATYSAAADTAQVYRFYCAQCHGVEGKGDGVNVTEDFATDPRDFTNKAEMEKLSDADIKNVILDGGPSISKSSLMPPWSETLTEPEVEGLVRHLRGLCDCQGGGS